MKCFDLNVGFVKWHLPVRTINISEMCVILGSLYFLCVAPVVNCPSGIFLYVFRFYLVIIQAFYLLLLFNILPLKKLWVYLDIIFKLRIYFQLFDSRDLSHSCIWIFQKSLIIFHTFTFQMTLNFAKKSLQT